MNTDTESPFVYPRCSAIVTAAVIVNRHCRRVVRYLKTCFDRHLSHISFEETIRSLHLESTPRRHTTRILNERRSLHAASFALSCRRESVYAGKVYAKDKAYKPLFLPPLYRRRSLWFRLAITYAGRRRRSQPREREAEIESERDDRKCRTERMWKRTLEIKIESSAAKKMARCRKKLIKQCSILFLLQVSKYENIHITYYLFLWYTIKHISKWLHSFIVQ